MRVQCNCCGWVGDEEQLVVSNDGFDEYCPKCKESKGLMNVEEDD